MTVATSVPASIDAKTTVAQSTIHSIAPQHSIIPTALSRISEDSTKPVAPHRCLNIAGIEKYPDLQGALPRAWSVPALASHVRAYLEAPLVGNCFIISITFVECFIENNIIMYKCVHVSFFTDRFSKLHSMICCTRLMS